MYPSLPFSLILDISFCFDFSVCLCLNLMSFFSQNAHSSSLPQSLCSVCTLPLDCFLSLHNPCQAKALSFQRALTLPQAGQLLVLCGLPQPNASPLQP